MESIEIRVDCIVKLSKNGDVNVQVAVVVPGWMRERIPEPVLFGMSQFAMKETIEALEKAIEDVPKVQAGLENGGENGLH